MMPQTVRFITVGSLKESYLREAVAEYRKRLSGLCRVEEVELKEARLPEDPSPAEVQAALASEAKAILAAIPARSYPVALCVEGVKLSSPALTEKLQDVCRVTGSLCFIIGSSHGLSEEVKRAANVRLSMGRITMPHQLARLVLTEQIYRACTINAGMKYHK